MRWSRTPQAEVSRQADALIAAGEVSLGLSRYADAVSDYPNDRILLTYYALALREAGRIDDAFCAAYSAIEVDR